MADRSSANLFRQTFELLAQNPTDENKTKAREIYINSFEYDFSTYQMDADDYLIKLGLAEMDKNNEIKYLEI